MSRSATRARRRLRRFEDGLREAITQARNDDAKAAQMHDPKAGHGELWQLLKELDRWDLCVWDVSLAVACTEEEKAMIAQAVAPSLAAMTPGNVRHRHGLAG